MRFATRFALLPVFPHNPAADAGAGPSRTRVWLKRAAAAASLLASSAAPPAQAIPLPPGFENIASLLSTGGIPLTGPTDTAIAVDGTVYIANGGANNIVKVQPDGTAAVFNISGVGSFNFPACDALDSAGNLYISDLGNARIVKVTPAGVGSVVSTGAVTLAAPAGIAVDYAGNIFVADIGNDTVVEVPASGPAVTMGITGVGALSGPNGVSVDTSGNLFVADSNNSRIVVVAGASTGATAGTVLNITGPSISGPHGVATDNAGTVYIDDTNNARIVKVAPDGTGTVLSTPTLGFAINDHIKRSLSGKLYVADQGANQIVEVQDTTVDFGKVQLGSATPSNQTLRFFIPPGVTVRAVKILTDGAKSKDFVEGNAAPCIRHGAGTNCAPINNDCVGATNTVCKVGVDFLPATPGLRQGAVVLTDGEARPLYTVPLHGWGSAPVAAIYPGVASVINTGNVSVAAPFQSAFDGAGNQYVAAFESFAVYKIPPDGGSATPVNTRSIQLGAPSGVAVDGAGNLFISDYAYNHVVVVSADGAVNLLAINNLAGALAGPLELHFDAAGTLYINDYYNARIVRVDGLSVTDAGASGSGSAVPVHGFSFASGSLIGDAMDSSGNLYVADYQQSQIVKVDPSGVATVLATPGYTLLSPYGLATDMAGNVYISDTGNGRILQVTPAGAVSVVALPGTGSAVEALSMTVSPTGNLYVNDFGSNRLIELDVGTGSTLDFPNTDIGSLSAALSSSVVNLGDLNLVMTQAPSYPAIFPQSTSVSGRCGGGTVLANGDSCVVAAAFAPNSTGVLSSNIVLTDNSLNAVNATQNVPVTGKGIGVPGLKLSTTALGFGEQALGTTSTTRSVTLTNDGQATLHLFHILISGDFHQTSTCGSSLAIGASCSIAVSFKPTADGARNGSLTIVSSAPSNPDVVSLSGTGSEPVIHLSAASLNFGQTINNQLTSRTLTVTNSGSGTLLIGQVTTTYGFTASTTCGAVPAHGSCQILVVFRTSSIGTIDGELTIKSNATNGTATVAVTGTNIAEPTNGTGGGAMGEDVIGMLAFAAWLRRRLKVRARSV